MMDEDNVVAYWIFVPNFECCAVMNSVDKLWCTRISVMVLVDVTCSFLNLIVHTFLVWFLGVNTMEISMGSFLL